jgi:hypothetical protein
MSNYHQGFYTESADQTNSIEIWALIPCGYITINWICTIELRSPFWGSGLRNDLKFQEAFMDLVEQKWEWIDPSKLQEATSILLKHEHQLPNDPQSYIFVINEQINWQYILRLRLLIQFKDSTIVDSTIVLAEEKIWVDQNPSIIYMNSADFQRFIRVLGIAHRLQIEKYQSEVDRLLSILPPS